VIAAPAIVVAALLLTTGCGVFGGAPGGDPTSSAASEPPVIPRTGPAEIRQAVAYATTSPRQTLDLYLPEGDGATVFPIVVLIHGGAFVSGDSSDLAGLAKLLSSEGFAAASINYRLSGDALFPAGLQDVAAAVRYLRANARSWGVDAHRMGVWGESAGAYLASMTAAAADRKRFDDVTLGYGGVSSQVQAVVSWFGPSDFATMDEQARAAGCDASSQEHHLPDSPESLWLGAPLGSVPDRVQAASVVRAVGDASALPPFLLVHGERDCTVAAGQSRQLEQALAQRSAQVRLILVPDAAHGDERIKESQTRPSFDFLRSVLKVRHPSSGDGA
jgi:acetyl esterase/lipase